MILFLREDLGGAFIFSLPNTRETSKDQANNSRERAEFFFADYGTLSELEGFEAMREMKRKDTKVFMESVIKQAKALSTTPEEADKLLSNYCSHRSIAKRTDALYELLASFQVYKDAGELPSGGLVCLYGGSGSGKTTFARDLVDAHVEIKRDIVAIGASEPDWTSAPIDVGLRALLLACTSISGSMNIVFDSFRSIIYGSGGATLSGGVSASMLEIVMNISRLAASSGKTVLGVINPLNTDELKNETLIEALKGSTSGVIKFSADNFDVLNVSIRTSSDRNFVAMPRSKVLERLCSNELWGEVESVRTITPFKGKARVQEYVFNHDESRSEINDQMNALKGADTLNKLEFN